MAIQPEILQALTVILVSAFIVIGIVAVLAPAALAIILRPLLDTISKLADLLAGKHDEEK